jgi:alkanesulfonate monooxygenase SsuD/methylene tetrahydromethanopterin reductase-like flavin-dependent oxidoreductase (luciferase family)
MTTAVHVSPTAALDLDALSATARALDSAPDDYLLVLGDDYTSGQNAVTLAAWLAPQTTRLRIVPEVPVTHTEPFHVATSTATLDYAATGRAGWSPVAQTSDAAADAVGRRPAASVEAAWGEVPDVVAAVRALWTSWEPDAEIRDEATHRFIDRDKVHYVDATGTDSVGQPWSVKGPSIVPRPPQGELPTVTIVDDRFHTSDGTVGEVRHITDVAGLLTLAAQVSA